MKHTAMHSAIKRLVRHFFKVSFLSFTLYFVLKSSGSANGARAVCGTALHYYTMSVLLFQSMTEDNGNAFSSE